MTIFNFNKDKRNLGCPVCNEIQLKDQCIYDFCDFHFVNIATQIKKGKVSKFQPLSTHQLLIRKI